MNKAKIKGAYWENKCARELNRSFRKSGFEFRRTLLSGSAGEKYKEHAGDIQIMDSNGSWRENQVEIECKRRKALKTDCLIKGSSIVDDWIMDLCNAPDKRKNSNRGRTDWALLIKTSKERGKKFNIEHNEFILLPDDRVGQHHADLPWLGYPRNRLACNTYSWAPLRDFLKIKDGYKYFLV